MSNKEFYIRKVEKEDYNRNHLELYQQLTIIDPKIIKKNHYEDFIEKLNDNHQIFVICDNDKIIASGTIIIENKLIRNMSNLGHIEDIVVDNNYRGYGLGKKIIDYLVGYANLFNCYKITLDCNEKNTKFYENCNFNKSGVQMTMYKKNLMSKL